MATGVHYTTELLDLPSSFCGECCNLEHALLRLEWTLLELETVGSCMELSYYTPSVACRAHSSYMELSYYTPSVACRAHSSYMELSYYTPSVACRAH